MRNNITIKGIEEVENETWDTTKKLLTKYLTYLQPEEYDDNTPLRIERAHRGGKKKKDHPRHIFARLYSSEDCTLFTDLSRHDNIKNPHTKCKIELQFSPKVTDRRNEAMKKRREHIQANSISSGYHNYPAKLMVRKNGGKEFYLHSEF